MTASKHTPGPWRVGDAGQTIFGPPTDQPAPKIIANIGRGSFATATSRANARLIAAAPELLKEASNAVNMMEWYEPDDDSDSATAYRCALARLQLAIAKAEGSTD